MNFYEEEIKALRASTEKLHAKIKKIDVGIERMGDLLWSVARHPETAVFHWRNDVCKRVQPSVKRPLLIRIPKIFMESLKLTLQRVQLQADGSVLEVTQYSRTKTKLNIVTGRMIVPPMPLEPVPPPYRSGSFY